MAVKEHYDTLLAGVYGWMLGDQPAKRQEQLAFFQRNGIAPSGSAAALDLGAGNGLQSIPLARLGYSVKAIDLSPLLLNELEAEAGSYDITTVLSDLSDVRQYDFYKPELIVCMGDTLTHLPSIKKVIRLLKKWYAMLDPGGKLILSFREMNEPPPENRLFIPIRSDNERIMTCLLEYQKGKVRVTDIVHEKNMIGWELRASSYFKLRLSGEQVTVICRSIGFALVASEQLQGMLYFIFLKR